MENIEGIITMVYELAVKYGLKLLIAIVTLLVGLWIIKLILKAMDRNFEKRNFDPTLGQFLKSLFGISLKILLIITVISMVGIEMTSFVAILAAAGFAIGMALSGTLQNFAGGVILVIFKPFKVGDYIDAQGYSGTVSAIHIFNTILKTPDNKTVIIPNGGLSTGSLTNYSTEPHRRVDFTFGIGYTDDIDKAKAVIEGIIKADKRIFTDPAPFIAVSELADSSVNLVVRVWSEASNYWAINFDMYELVKKAFDKEGISIPYPQTDVHVYNSK
ncbi:MAG: mechanosensitive ion channel [Bacteroidales bacterium]|nr:mechanosensitive ion channel [Bacteroidales bacterium]MCF8403611.1 mechanosensitive ion channel [Bacteroidales bacterium]